MSEYILPSKRAAIFMDHPMGERSFTHQTKNIKGQLEEALLECLELKKERDAAYELIERIAEDHSPDNYWQVDAQEFLDEQT